MYTVRLENKISTKKFRGRLKMNNRRECLANRRRQWFGHLEKIEDMAWSSK